MLLGVLGLVVFVLAVCEALGWPFLRDPLQRRLAAALQRDVRFGGDFELRLLGAVRLAAKSLVVGSPAGAPVLHDAAGRPQPLLDADGIALKLPYATLLALLRGDAAATPRVRSLVVERLDLGLARSADGRANWRIAPAAEPRKGGLPEFGSLIVRAGRLRLDDAPSRLVLDARLRTHEGARGDGAGLEVSATGSYRGSPLQARLRSSGLLPLAAPIDGSVPTVPLQFELSAGQTRLELDGRVGDLLRLAALDAGVQMRGASLAVLGDALGLTLPDTSAFALQGRLRKSGPQIDATVAELKMGSSKLQGDFSFDPRPDPPLLKGRLGGSRLALADLGPAFGARRQGAPDPDPQRLLPQRKFDLPSLSAMDADVTVRLDEVSFGGTGLDTLAPLDGRVRLADSVLTIDGLHAGLSRGELRGSLSLDARARQPRWHGDLAWSGVRLEQFVKPRKPRAVERGRPARSEPATAYVSGLLGGRAKLQGSGSSTAAMLGSLDGSLEAWVRQGRVSSLLTEAIGLDLIEMLGVVMAGDEGLPLHCAVARFAVHNGMLLPEVAVLATPDTTLFIGGELSLAKETLALTITQRPHDMSLLSLRAPVYIEGSFVAPKVRLDAGRIGLRAAAAAALAAAVAPLAGLLALADFGEPERAVCSEALARMRNPAASKRAAPAKEK